MASLLCESHVAWKPPVVMAIQAQVQVASSSGEFGHRFPVSLFRGRHVVVAFPEGTFFRFQLSPLVKSTYSRCRKYFVERGRQAQRQLNEGQVYCSKLVKELRKNQEQACTHIVRMYDIYSTRFEVVESFNPITQRGGQKWAVNLNGHHCQCGRYSAFHYPCSHIIATCGYVSMNYYQYIDVVYTNEHILKAYSAQWWPLGNEAAIPPSDDAWTLIPDPTTIRAKGRPKSTRIRNEMDWVLPLGYHVAAKGSWSAMKNEGVFPQHHHTNVSLQTYQYHDLRKDTDTSAKDTEKMLVACSTFHGHVAPFVGKNLPLEQSPFVCQNLEFPHWKEACQTVVAESDALMLDHVPQAQ
ncbi:hypothetical protein GmHk_11G032644 [Glycine max]|nr:hypothetical protein GmHk_11G032644 [Glycine max]